MKINEQLVLVTGGSRGLGAAIARSFVREGAQVIINYYQSKEKAEKLAEELGPRALALQGDVRSKEDMENLFRKAEEHFGKSVTTIIHNALIDFQFDSDNKKDAFAIEWEDVQKQLEGSVRGALNIIQAGLEKMKASKFGRIITIGTNLFQNPVVSYHDYTTAKAALLALTRNMAQELGPYNITVNMVSGGLLKTTDASRATSDEVFKLIEASTPLRRVTSPEELADAVLFFASPWSRAVTGQNLVVDGGLVMD